MSNLNIGRYDESNESWSGYIEGSADGVRWIIYLDESGAPALYWPSREDSGAVIGEPVVLNATSPALS